MDNQARLSQTDEEILNTLSSLASSLGGSDGVQLSQTDTLFSNNRWYLISNLRQLLTQLYAEHGVVQTLVDQPVDDAFRAGYELKSGQLDADDMEKIKIYDERNGVSRSLMQAIKWGRLYGGGGVIIITDQDPATPLNIKKINPQTPLEFRSSDMWEFFFSQQNVQGSLEVGGQLGEGMGDHYDYYGHKLHKSRVYKITGKEAPSFLRPRLRGWGMSELERLVRSLNQYLKNQDVIFELLDEAKIDVYRMSGFNDSLMNAGGTEKISQRIQMANQLKNYNSAITMDIKDEYLQKQISFAGLSEVLLQIRQGLAADLKMPMTKLFGISAAGFSSGEDDIENYNSMLEGEIRAKNKFNLVGLMQIVCQKLFGDTIDDLMLEFNPLRILNAKEEEEVKNSQFNRVMNAWQSGLIQTKEAKDGINKDSLLPVEIDINTEAMPPIGADFTVGEASQSGGGEQTPKTA